MGEFLRRLNDTLSEGRKRAPYRNNRSWNVAYVGWIGYGNLGDEVMYEQLKAGWPDFNIVHYEYLRREARLARFGLSGSAYFGYGFLGGGTLISPYNIEFVESLLDQGVTLSTLGTGVGSSGYESPLEVELEAWKALLPRFDHLGLRGPRSVSRLEKLGIRNACVIGDFALSMARKKLTEPANPRKFGLNITLPNDEVYGSGSYPVVTALEEVVRKLTGEGWEPVPIAMALKDIEPTQMLIDRVAAAPVPTRLVTTAEECFSLLEDCSFTIAIRLHAAILSVCVGVPPLMLGYRDKCLDFMESVDLSQWYVDLNTASPGEMRSRAYDLSAAAPSLRADTLAQAQKWQRVQHEYLETIRASFKGL